MKVLTIATHKKNEVIDMTDLCDRELESWKDGNGIVHLCLLHTTAALTTADLDPGTDLDLLDAFEALVPKLNYRHPHNPRHTPDHILSALIGTSLSLPVKSGELLLGQWQRVILIEFDGPRSRQVAATFISEA
jgi:secondary thiamine-phosphate synthase enzyme